MNDLIDTLVQQTKMIKKGAFPKEKKVKLVVFARNEVHFSEKFIS